MEILGDPTFLRGFERIIIVLSAVFIVYLGFRLFLFGIDRGYSELKTESKFVKLTFSGTGPGLFFMAFGALILIFALFTGKAEKRSQSVFGNSSLYNSEILHKVSTLDKLEYRDFRNIKKLTVPEKLSPPLEEISFGYESGSDIEEEDSNKAVERNSEPLHSQNPSP